MIRLEPTRAYMRDYSRLPERIRQAADERLRLFVLSPRYPSLRLKRVQGTEACWEISINMQYRVILERVSEDHFELIAIGTHKTLDVH